MTLTLKKIGVAVAFLAILSTAHAADSQDKTPTSKDTASAKDSSSNANQDSASVIANQKAQSASNQEALDTHSTPQMPSGSASATGAQANQKAKDAAAAAQAQQDAASLVGNAMAEKTNQTTADQDAVGAAEKKANEMANEYIASTPDIAKGLLEYFPDEIYLSATPRSDNASLWKSALEWLLPTHSGNYSDMVRDIFKDCIGSIAKNFAALLFVIGISLNIYKMVDSGDGSKLIPFFIAMGCFAVFYERSESLVNGARDIIRSEVVSIINGNNQKYFNKYMTLTDENGTPYPIGSQPSYIKHMMKVYSEENISFYNSMADSQNGGEDFEKPIPLAQNHITKVFRTFIYDTDHFPETVLGYRIIGFFGDIRAYNLRSPDEQSLYKDDAEFDSLNHTVRTLKGAQPFRYIALLAKVEDIRLRALKVRVPKLAEVYNAANEGRGKQEARWSESAYYAKTIAAYEAYVADLDATVKKIQDAAKSAYNAAANKNKGVQIGAPKKKGNYSLLTGFEGNLSQTLIDARQMIDASAGKTASDMQNHTSGKGAPEIESSVSPMKVLIAMFTIGIWLMNILMTFFLGVAACICAGVVMMFEALANFATLVEFYITLPLIPLAVATLCGGIARNVGLSILKNAGSCIIQLGIVTFVGATCDLVIGKAFLALVRIMAFVDTPTQAGEALRYLTAAGILNKIINILVSSLLPIILTDTIGTLIIGAIIALFYWLFFHFPSLMMQIFGLKDTTNLALSLANTMKRGADLYRDIGASLTSGGGGGGGQSTAPSGPGGKPGGGGISHAPGSPAGLAAAFASKFRRAPGQKSPTAKANAEAVSSIARSSAGLGSRFVSKVANAGKSAATAVDEKMGSSVNAASGNADTWNHLKKRVSSIGRGYKEVALNPSGPAGHIGGAALRAAGRGLTAANKKWGDGKSLR